MTSEEIKQAIESATGILERGEIPRWEVGAEPACSALLIRDAQLKIALTELERIANEWRAYGNTSGWAAQAVEKIKGMETE